MLGGQDRNRPVSQHHRLAGTAGGRSGASPELIKQAILQQHARGEVTARSIAELLTGIEGGHPGRVGSQCVLDELGTEALVGAEGPCEVPGMHGDVTGAIDDELAAGDATSGMRKLYRRVRAREGIGLTVHAASELGHYIAGISARGGGPVASQQADRQVVARDDVLDEVIHRPVAARCQVRPLVDSDELEPTIERIDCRVEQVKLVHAPQGSGVPPWPRHDRDAATPRPGLRVIRVV